MLENRSETEWRSVKSWQSSGQQRAGAWRVTFIHLPIHWCSIIKGVYWKCSLWAHVKNGRWRSSDPVRQTQWRALNSPNRGRTTPDFVTMASMTTKATTVCFYSSLWVIIHYLLLDQQAIQPSVLCPAPGTRCRGMGKRFSAKCSAMSCWDSRGVRRGSRRRGGEIFRLQQS